MPNSWSYFLTDMLIVVGIAGSAAVALGLVTWWWEARGYWWWQHRRRRPNLITRFVEWEMRSAERAVERQNDLASWIGVGAGLGILAGTAMTLIVHG